MVQIKIDFQPKMGKSDCAQNNKMNTSGEPSIFGILRKIMNVNAKGFLSTIFLEKYWQSLYDFCIFLQFVAIFYNFYDF